MACRLTPHLEDIRKWKTRQSLVWIGKRLRVSSRTVARFCDKNLIPYKKRPAKGEGTGRKPQPKWARGDIDRLIALHASGLSFAVIAAELGRTQRAVEAKLFHMGMGVWTKKPPVNRRKPDESFALLMRGRLFDIRATPDAGGPKPSRPMTVVEGCSSMAMTEGSGGKRRAHRSATLALDSRQDVGR